MARAHRAFSRGVSTAVDADARLEPLPAGVDEGQRGHGRAAQDRRQLHQAVIVFVRFGIQDPEVAQLEEALPLVKRYQGRC